MKPKMSTKELAARRAGVDALLEHVNHEVAALPQASMRELLPVLHDAERELERDLARWLAKAAGDEAFSAQQLRVALVNIRGAIKKINQFAPHVKQALVGGASRAGSLAVKHVEHELAAFSKLYDASLRPVPLREAAIIARGKKTLMQRFTTSATRYAGQVGTDLRHQIALGLVRGETMRELVKRLVGPGSTLKLGKLDVLPDAAGMISERLFDKYEFWAARLVRTEVINAYNVEADEAIREAHAVDPDIARRWDAALDGRTCAFCGSLDGTVVGIKEAFPGGVDHPPAHPQCRCAVVVWRRDWPTDREVKGSLGRVEVKPLRRA